MAAKTSRSSSRVDALPLSRGVHSLVDAACAGGEQHTGGDEEAGAEEL